VIQPESTGDIALRRAGAKAPLFGAIETVMVGFVVGKENRNSGASDRSFGVPCCRTDSGPAPRAVPVASKISDTDSSPASRPVTTSVFYKRSLTPGRDGARLDADPFDGAGTTYAHSCGRGPPPRLRGARWAATPTHSTGGWQPPPIGRPYGRTFGMTPTHAKQVFCSFMPSGGQNRIRSPRQPPSFHPPSPPTPSPTGGRPPPPPPNPPPAYAGAVGKWLCLYP
jgi:hypothetical protein